jgi:pimeloyl-ACP methyl ester carboxylesterase
MSRGTLLIVMLLAAAVTGLWWAGRAASEPGGTSSPPSTPAPSAPRRELVLIVPGTLGADESWFAQLPGHISFASELTRGFLHQAERDGAGAGREVIVRRLLWDSDFRQARRSEAAEHLAREIDRQADGFDAVHLVGHSHGGNVALMAAAHTARRLDTLVCLATPHLEFELQSGALGERVWVPLFVGPRLGERVGRVVNVRARRDIVAQDLAEWINGISDAEAIDLTRPWQTASQDLVTADDDVWTRLIGTSRVRARARLRLPSLQDVVVPSEPGLDPRVHSRLHCLRIGWLLGRVLAGAPVESTLRSLLLDDQTDTGEARPGLPPDSEPPPRGAWVARIRLEIANPPAGPEGEPREWDLDGSLPDPRLLLAERLAAEGEDVLVLEAETRRFVPDGELQVRVFDDDALGADPVGEPWQGAVEQGRLPARIETAAWSLVLESWPVW